MNLKDLFLAETLFLTACDDGDTADTPTTDPTSDAGTPTADAGFERPDYSCDGVDIRLDDSKDDVAQTIV